MKKKMLYNQSVQGLGRKILLTLGLFLLVLGVGFSQTTPAKKTPQQIEKKVKKKKLTKQELHAQMEAKVEKFKPTPKRNHINSKKMVVRKSAVARMGQLPRKSEK